MNSTRGLGPVAGDRRRRRPARDAHAAPGAAGDLRPLDLLAGAARTFGSAEPTESGVVGADRPAHRPPAARRLGGHRAGAGRAVARPRSSCDAAGLSNADSFTGNPDSVVGEEVLGPALPGGRGQPGRRDRGTGQRPASRCAAALAASTDGHRSRPPGTEPVVRRQACCSRRTLTAPPDSQAAQGHRRPGARRGARGARAPTPRSAAAPRSLLDMERAADARQQADHPAGAASWSS